MSLYTQTGHNREAEDKADQVGWGQPAFLEEDCPGVHGWGGSQGSRRQQDKQDRGHVRSYYFIEPYEHNYNSNFNVMSK